MKHDALIIIDMQNGLIKDHPYNEQMVINNIKTLIDACRSQHLPIIHSDQGWQYQMEYYHTLLKEKGIIQSMSRKGNCLDNSPMENFFGKMKNEMFYGFEYSFESLDELKVAMEEYIEYYNTQRITIKLKGLTPVQYRNQSFLVA